MKFVLITGSCGLVGSDLFLFLKKGYNILGIDNNARKTFGKKVILLG